MPHVMVDLETWGTGPHAVIISIGAVKFDSLIHVDSWDRFQVDIDPNSAIKAGQRADADTLLWWMHADRTQAREAFLAASKVDLQDALDGFAQWLGRTDYRVWGNGASFDNVILATAYRLCGIPAPWRFWNDRCYRTMKNMAPEVKMERVGTYHRAVDDAVSQADHLLRIAGALGITL
jgi:hypothetical protein